MEQLKRQIKDAAKEALADIVGVAARDRFEGMDDAVNPFTLFPQGKAAILLARRVTRGSLRGVEEGTNFGDFNMFGKSWLADEFLAQTVYTVAAFIERAGYEAMPVTPGRKAGVDGVGSGCDPDFGWAAVACGVGELGLSGEILTPRFGPRQRFALILTDAELPSDPLLNRPVCTRCGKCAAICPLKALDAGHAEAVRICGREMSVAGQNFALCAKCGNGAIAERVLTQDSAPTDKMIYTHRGTVTQHGHIDRMAALCTRTCVQALEEAGALENNFETPFRIRNAWGKNEFGESVEVAEGGKQ